MSTQPAAAPQATPPRLDGSPPLLGALRVAARDAQLRGPVDLDALAAAGGAEDARLWALALIAAAARGERPLEFRRRPHERPSPCECWLTALVRAAGAGDEASVAFLTRRFLPQTQRRLAVCFAQRLADSLRDRPAA